MIREIIKPTSEYINIKVPQEYIDKDVEILLFSSNEISKIEVKQNANELLDEFKKFAKNPIELPNDINYELKTEDGINNDLF